MLEKFGSIKSIIDANEKELTTVEGVGKKKAREIQKIIHAKYKNNENEKENTNKTIKETIEKNETTNNKPIDENEPIDEEEQE